MRGKKGIIVGFEPKLQLKAHCENCAFSETRGASVGYTNFEILVEAVAHTRKTGHFVRLEGHTSGIKVADKAA